MSTAVELAASCSIDLGFEQYRFPGFPVPDHERRSRTCRSCAGRAPASATAVTSAVVTRLAHELGVIERAGLAEFFLICWDLMRFAKEKGIPAQSSATSSIVSYTLGSAGSSRPSTTSCSSGSSTRDGRYPDVDIDFSRAAGEVIQYVYNRYGPDHTGMVTSSRTGRVRPCARWVTRSGSAAVGASRREGARDV